ncbi:hypothetical protein EDD85DRAFT_830303 [Armillaria nabsnona]|nr:hypothetical protein EDD85DRAFT_830303 [Armillaria nabsnona]
MESPPFPFRSQKRVSGLAKTVGLPTSEKWSSSSWPPRLSCFNIKRGPPLHASNQLRRRRLDISPCAVFRLRRSPPFNDFSCVSRRNTTLLTIDMFGVVIIRHTLLAARPGMGYSALVGLDASSLSRPWYGQGKCYKCYAPCGAEGRHSLLHCSGGMDKNRLRRDSSSEGINVNCSRS